jgi:hypothetical protein
LEKRNSLHSINISPFKLNFDREFHVHENKENVPDYGDESMDLEEELAHDAELANYRDSSSRSNQGTTAHVPS